MLRLEEFRNVIQANMPYDTGFMFLSGAQYFETEHFLYMFYDIYRVPYIIFQEEGFVHYLSGKFIDKNRFFIKNRTIGAINRTISYNDVGLRVNTISQFEELNNRRGSLNMIKQGALVKISSEGMGMEDLTKGRR